jgi:hypothetical protein
MNTSDRVLRQEEVDQLPTGSTVTVLWDGFKSCFWTYHVENIGGFVYCTEVEVAEQTWRATATPLLLAGCVLERTRKSKGTVVLGTLPAPAS